MRLEQAESHIRYTVDLALSEAADGCLRRNLAGLSPETLARFLSKIKVIPGACWAWTGARFPGGYGRFPLGRHADGRTITASAHRLAYELAHGPLGSLQANHACDNPACCRPEPGHIYAGTHLDNMQDRKQAGRYEIEHPKAWHVEATLRRRLIAECLAAPRRSGTIARLAREHNIPFHQLYLAVARASRKQFDAATTGLMAAHR